MNASTSLVSPLNGAGRLQKRQKLNDELGLESPDLAPPPARHELWKVAWRNFNGHVTSQCAQEISQRMISREDLLVAATGWLDRLGRVHGVGGAIGLRNYFGPKPRSTEAVTQEMVSSIRQQSQQEDAPTDDPTAPRVSTKGSCSTADRTDYNIQHEFLVDEDPPRVVAVGRQIAGGQTIHGAPLLPTHARVMIDGPRDPQARVPTSEIQFMGEALGTFIAWPKAMIMPYFGPPAVYRPEK
ncbi:hypothetical protein LR48_Vigan07g150800 [Vigna angularis]|uniref:DUF8039 domain-containing protein n=1 Tax=Phaseolus angularis TaxID=3914 RepID=A0A0L9UZ23_PHAAN|nr:hypothetical protein LR48_Vigan07g150800 [Vigna angularis]